MGGKTKQSQRTKNNVRPSSSGRSALLLSNVSLETGVMKIAGAELPPLFPTLAAPIIDPLVSPELQMCIKKLNKKDPITKTKALQELLELVSNNKVDDIVAALPSWAHFYKMLTADPDRKVREVTQSCHGKIVSLCGRRIAPQLRALVPAWLQAQYDEHAPAQTHAQSSLAKTFPDSKLPEVVSFCKNEIVTHLVDNLTGTGEIIFIRKTDTPEEKEIQLIRILSSSLHGIQYTVQHLPREHDDWLWERVDGLLKANLFWKRATHSEIRIRAAWYAAVGSIIERYKNKFAEPYGQKTLRILIGAKEPSPLAAAQLWDSVLLFMYNVQEWHKYLDKPELLGKRILDVLENGGWGDARHLSNILLPLLAQLPPVMVTKEFFISFFNAIFVGLEKKTILSSKSERQTWITSLDECLRYLSIQSHEFVQGVVSSVHRTWLETILSDAHDGQIRTNLIKHSASNMATLVKYWLKQAKENNSEKYDQLIRNFWQNVGATVTAQVDKLSTDHADIAKLIDGHILLLQTLKTSFIQETKKQQCIKFDGDTPTAIEKPKEIQQCDASIVERYNHNLNDLVQKICGHYLEFASKKEISSPVLVPLITLLNDYDSESLFTGIARQFECDTTYKLYERVFRSWLAGDTMRCKEVLDIIFLFMKHLAETEQDALFDSFKQFPPSVVEWCISLSLSHPHCLVPSVRRWLRSTLVEATVCSICRRVVETGDSKAKSLLLMCLNHDTNGDIIVNESAVSKVLDQLSVGVGDVTSPALEVVATVGARLCTTLCAPGARLVLALFELSVRVPRGSEQLSLDTWCEVLAAWQDGLVSLPDSERADTLQQAAKLLQTHTRIDQKTVDLKQIEHVISLCPYLLSTNSEQDIPEIVEFSRVILDTAPVDVTTVLPYILRHTIVKGEMNCPFQDAHVTKFITEDYTRDFIKEMTRDNLISYLNNCTYRAMYLKTILLHKVDEDLDDTLCNDLLLDDYFKERFCDVLHDFLVICAMFDAYAFWPNYDIIKQTKHRLDSLIESMTLECTTKTKTHILNALSEIAATKGYYWAFARKWFENCTTSDNTNRVFCCDESDECYQANESIQDKVEGDQENIEVNEESRGKEDKKTIESSQETVESDKQDVERLDLEDLKSKVTGCGFFHNLQADAHWSSESPLRTKYLLMLRCFYAAHASEPGVIDYTFKAAQISCNPDVIIDAYYRHNHVMLCEMDITSAPWAQVVSNAAIVDYLATLVATRGWTMESQHWDFANITVCNLLSSVVKSKKRWGSTKMALFTRAVLKLFVEIQTFISTIKQECLKRQPSETVAHLPTEWTDVFAPDLNQNLFSLIMYILESSTKKSVSANHMAVLDGLILCTRLINWDLLPEPRRTGAFTLKALVKRGAAVLSDTVHHSFKYLAYELLLVMLKPVILDDASLLAAWSSEEEAREEGEDRPAPTFSLQLYDDAFFKLQDLVETAVAHINVCDATCELVEFTDVHVLALGWFLLVEVMGRQCRLARGDLQQHYIETYRENKYAVPLLTSALRLLPAEVFAHAQESDTPVNPRYAPMFTRLTPLNVYRECSGRTVSAAACRALYWCVVGAGAGETRGWRGAAAYKHARLLDNVVTAYISPQVVKDEFTLVQQKISEVEDTEVNILWAVYELTATLTLEDRPIDLRVMLSRSHPLGLPQLEAPEHGPASNCNWIIMYLGYQNGTLINALKMWTEAVTRKVERAPQCYICYCRLHFLTGRLPNTYCRTCRNKFHTPCLRKWLQTSTTPTCPLCRSHM